VDHNKAIKLSEIGYELQTACGSCAHGSFAWGAVFGDCNLFTYAHAKHSRQVRPLSVLRYGTCPSYEPRVDYEQQTDHFVF
jgi:hypothetical protein